MDKPCKSVSPAKESKGILEGKRQGWRDKVTRSREVRGGEKEKNIKESFKTGR